MRRGGERTFQFSGDQPLVEDRFGQGAGDRGRWNIHQLADAEIEHDAAELRARDTAAQEAAASNTSAGNRYAAGGISTFDLLDAQRQALQTALDRTRAQADRLADTAALFQALAGSWTNDAAE